MALVQLK